MKAVKDYLMYFPGGEMNEGSGTSSTLDEDAQEAETDDATKLNESDFDVDEDDDSANSDEDLEEELEDDAENDKETVE